MTWLAANYLKSKSKTLGASRSGLALAQQNSLIGTWKGEEMSQTRFSWKIDDFIAPGTPLTGELLAYSESLPGSHLSDSQAKNELIIFWVGRFQDRYTPQFNHYAISGRQIKRMTIQLEKISDKGALLSRTTYSFSDIKVTKILATEGDKQFTEQLSFEGQSVSTSPSKN
jgi:hypothetical protein